MKKLMIGLLLAVFLLGCTTTQSPSLVNYANPLVGTDSEFKFSNGNTFPAIAMPFGMTTWTPATSKPGDGWTYQYKKDKIVGIEATHQPSPWINDYADFSLMAMTKELKTNWQDRAATFSHDDEIARPDYYKVKLSDSNIEIELSPSERCSHWRIHFPQDDKAFLLLDAHPKGTMVKVLPDEQKIIGFTRANHGGVPDNFAGYFVVQFDQKPTAWGTWDEEGVYEKSEHSGEHTGAFVEFSPQAVVELKIGTSFISIEQAELNLQKEIGDQRFAETRAHAENVWNSELAKIQISGATEDKKTTFYTALYRALLFPRMFYEFNENGEQIHYSPYDGNIHSGSLYADNGFWDTFRAVYPFFTLLYPERDAEIIRGWINAYKEGGWYPKWTSPGYRNCMIGTHVESLVADAYAKGITNFDAETAFAASKKDGTVASDNGAYGRVGLPDYLKLGYVPAEKYGEATARTLEFAYDDFCIARLAEMLGKDKDAEYFYNQAMNYKNVWYADKGFMWGKLANGNWEPHFSEFRWGDPFTEGSTWHYSWSVMQDMNGLIKLVGGRDAFCEKLDALISTAPEFDFGHYGMEIHEMTEMVACEMGQYAHGNQPVHHVLYLWNYAGQPWKSQQWVRHAATTLYGPGPDGLCGDEDNGQMSAWYIFSALGFYPVTPGVPQYVFGSPLFEKAVLNLPNGKTFTIHAKQNNAENIYIQNTKLNDKPFEQTWISHQDIVNGGSLVFEMADTPNQSWATSPEAAPYSMSTH